MDMDIPIGIAYGILIPNKVTLNFMQMEERDVLRDSAIRRYFIAFG